MRRGAHSTGRMPAQPAWTPLRGAKQARWQVRRLGVGHAVRRWRKMTTSFSPVLAPCCLDRCSGFLRRLLH